MGMDGLHGEHGGEENPFPHGEGTAIGNGGLTLWRHTSNAGRHPRQEHHLINR